MRNCSILAFAGTLATILSAIALTACGGGGSAPAPTTYTATCTDGSTKTSTVSQTAAQALCPVTPTSYTATCIDGTTRTSPVSLAAAQALCPTDPTQYTAVCSDGTTRTSTLGQAAAQALCPHGQDSTIVNAALPVASTYAANGLTEELAAFNLLNQERSRCGFGTLTQNAALDKAAKSHADWQNLNNTYGHVEVAGTPGFTGVGVTDRLTAAGYGSIGGSADDLTSFSGVTNKIGLGILSVRGLLNAPFHLASLMTGYREIGVAVRSSADVGTAFNTAIVQFNAGYTVAIGTQLQASSEVLTYPCQGTTGTDRQLRAEDPNPVPGRNLATNPLGGTVLVQLRAGNVLTINGATMLQVSNTSPVVLRPPVIGVLGPTNQGYIAADAPLMSNTQYQVTINGTNNGTAFTKTFTFTTGTGG